MRHPTATSTPSLFDVLPRCYHPFDAVILRKTSRKGGPPAVGGIAISVVGETKQLGMSLASEMQVGEALSGGGRAIAGPGTGTVFRDAGEMAAKYGGDAVDYVKKTSTSIAVQGKGWVRQIETHWVENTNTRAIYELKTRIHP